ncbi:MAG: sigma-70 family RNA polymerase sigma factor [Nocardioidaceae bacterium]
MPDAQSELLRTLHDDYGAALWAFALRGTRGDAAAAEDVVQETLLRAWRHIDTLDPEQGSPRAWLYSVAHRVMIDGWRKASHNREVVEADVPERATPDDTDGLLDGWLVEEALTRLSEDHRAVLVECYFRGQSTRAAAERLGIAEGTVKSRTHYALRALRLVLAEMGVTS